MSAWIVSKAHIDALVSAAMQGRDGLRWGDARNRGEIAQTETDVATEVGKMLWSENLASIHFRYHGPNGFTANDVRLYTFKRTKVLDAATVLKAISCYEYQSCEHPEWDMSEAHAFCEALRHKIINQIPGYDAAPWGLEDDDVYDGTICLTDLVRR